MAEMELKQAELAQGLKYPMSNNYILIIDIILLKYTKVVL